MSLAAETRAAVRARPFLRAALRAGVVNYAAAARSLDVDGDEEAVATALRRLGDELPPRDPESRDCRVRMRRNVTGADDLLSLDGEAYGDEADGDTAVIASGDVGPVALGAVLARLRAEDVTVGAAGAADGTLVVVVPSRAGPTALRAVESALDAVPSG